MQTSILYLLLLLVLVPGTVAGATSETARDRGCLSLAWDAHESGDFQGAIRYLDEIPADSDLSPDAAWLRAECLYDLGRYREAVGVLESGASLAIEDREAFLADVYWDWAWDATAREDYAEALDVLARSRRVLSDTRLAALEEATRYRDELRKAIERGGGRLSTGESVRVGEADASPGGPDWHRVHPWDAGSPWVPQVSMEEWMPSHAEALGERCLWVRVPSDTLVKGLQSAAFVRGFSARVTEDGLAIGAEGETVTVDLSEWAYRAAVEGLGSRGAVESVLADAAERLAAQAELTAWIAERRGELRVSREGRVVRLVHGGSGRTFDLDPAAWTDLFQTDPRAWEEFWADLGSELGRPAHPYRCFCGRPVALREVVVARPGEALVFERGRGYGVILIALCPLHQQYVTEGLVRSWGVSAREVWDKAREDIHEQPWSVSFGRRVEGGVEGIVLEAEGLSGIARYPELLLGVLEKVQGVQARSTVVQIRVPSPGTLVVAGQHAGERELRALSARSLLDAARREHRVERLDYRATVRLPSRGAGAFRVVPIDP